jgi:predicted Zn-dependent peptidase
MKKETLPNGLTAISAYSQLPYIGVCIGVNYGYIDDEEEKSGKGHFLEHMIFKGTYKRTADQIRKELIEYTFMTNGYINPEATFYIAEVRNKDALDKMLELLSDMIRNSILGENEMEMEKRLS